MDLCFAPAEDIAFFFLLRGIAGEVTVSLREAEVPSATVLSPPEFSRDLTDGSFCFNFNTGSKRSPNFFVLSSTWSDSNTSSLGSPFFRQLSTSSHFRGVETVGLSRARNEYTHIVVL